MNAIYEFLSFKSFMQDANGDSFRFTKATAAGLLLNVVLALAVFALARDQKLATMGITMLFLGMVPMLFASPYVIGGWLGSGTKPIPALQGFALPFLLCSKLFPYALVAGAGGLIIAGIVQVIIDFS